MYRFTFEKSARKMGDPAKIRVSAHGEKKEVIRWPPHGHE